MGEPPSSCLIQLIRSLLPTDSSLASSLGGFGSPAEKQKEDLDGRVAGSAGIFLALAENKATR